MHHLKTLGFTMVEMLVVMGVIALILGILLPSLSSFHAESEVTGCMSNLRQLYGFVDSARIADDGRLPNADILPAATPDGFEGGLLEALDGYINAENEIWFCPADHDSESLAAGTSYYYVVGLMINTPYIQFSLPTDAMELSEKERKRIESRLVTNFYTSTDSANVPLLMDSQDRHDHTRYPRNGVFIDGSVQRLDGKFEVPAQ